MKSGQAGGVSYPLARRRSGPACPASAEFPVGVHDEATVEAGVQPYVLVDTRDGVATLTLNRGERFNALSRPMIAALEAALDAIADDGQRSRRRHRGARAGGSAPATT